MSTTPPVPEPARAPLPPERRTLVVVLAAVESLLLVAASVLASLNRLQPGSVFLGKGDGSFCISSQGPFGGSPSGQRFPCPSGPMAQDALLVAAVCDVVALLVLPPVLGALSRRWQTALAAPSLPVWLALLAGVTLALVTKSNAFSLYPPVDFYGDLLYVGGLVVNIAGQLLIVLFLTAALGGLGWLARRALAR